ncbi:MAG: hypothetical protein ACNYZG_07435 [Gammaproteobacteria bacterium]
MISKLPSHGFPPTVMMMAIMHYLWRTIIGMTGVKLEEIESLTNRKKNETNVPK